MKSKLPPIPDYGLSERDFKQRQPHSRFLKEYEAENEIVDILSRGNVDGCIVTPGIVYGFGETVMASLYKRFYLEQLSKAPLYFGGHQRVLPFVHALDLALLVSAMCEDNRFPDKQSPFVFAVERQ